MSSSNGFTVSSTHTQAQKLALFQNKVFGDCIAPIRNIHTFSVMCNDNDGIIYNMSNYTYGDGQINDYYPIHNGEGGVSFDDRYSIYFVQSVNNSGNALKIIYST